MVILTFPRPYPDELLYSLFARYQVFSGNMSKKSTLKELYDGDSAYAVMDLPGHLNLVAQRLGHPWTSERLLLSHTLYPYYAYFLSTERASKAKILMLEGNGNNIHTSLGVNGSKLKPKNCLWVCNDCIKQDMNAYGETYWRRAHQLPYVFFCTEHHTVLSETRIYLKMKNSLSFVAADPSHERHEHDLKGLSKQDIDLLFCFSKQAVSLLSLSFEKAVGDNIRKVYVANLKGMGYTTHNGLVHHKKLTEAFCKRFSISFLEKMNSSLANRSSWLRIIFQKHTKSFHPVLHLILILFFEMERKKLSNTMKGQDLFGTAPWPCLNKICPKFQQDVVVSLTLGVSLKTNKNFGLFYCHHCGFSYYRISSGKTTEDRHKKQRVKDYGALWEKQLRAFLKDGTAVKEIALELGVSEYIIRGQVKAYGNIETLNEQIGLKDNLRIKKKIKEKTIKKYKEKWLSLLKEYPNSSRIDLRMQDARTYDFFKRHEKEWFNKNSPPFVDNHAIQKQQLWDERDDQLLKQTRQLIEEWDEGEEKLTKITLSRIGRKLGKFSVLDKNIEKLPKTKHYINEVVEDTDAFMNRRLKFILSQAQQNGEVIPFWKVIRKITPKSGVSEELKEYIRNQLADIDSK